MFVILTLAFFYTAAPPTRLNRLLNYHQLTMSRLMRPPYIDPVTGVAYDTDKGDYEGYLTKQSMWLRVRLFFYMLNHQIYFRRNCKQP